MADAEEVVNETERQHQERFNAVRNRAVNVVKKRVVAAGTKAVASAVAPWLVPIIGAIVGVLLIVGLVVYVISAACGASIFTTSGVELALKAISYGIPSEVCEAFNTQSGQTPQAQ